LTMGHPIIASAAKFETSEIVERLQNSGVNATQLVVGVGLTQAAIISARLRDLVAGRDVFFCCTAGILGNFRNVELFTALGVDFAPVDVRTGQGYLVTNSEEKLMLNSLQLPLPACWVHNSGSISLKTEKSTKDLPVLETLELYAVAKNWLPVAKSFTCVVAVTNAVGPDAHQQWKDHFRDAATLTADFLANEIKVMGRRWS